MNIYSSRNNHRCAFTLAEVLVTLGIIGVVSAMTVPSLMQNHQRKTYVVQLHKAYNELSQASVQYLTDNNAINLNEAGLTDINAFDDFMNNYFKIVKACGKNWTDCFSTEYKKSDGSSINVMADVNRDTRAYVLANGVFVNIIPDSLKSTQIHIDVNGAKGPNIVGRDIFALRLYNNGLLDDDCTEAPCSTETREANFNSYCKISSGTTWWGCFGKILNDNWEMTY